MALVMREDAPLSCWDDSCLHGTANDAAPCLGQEGARRAIMEDGQEVPLCLALLSGRMRSAHGLMCQDKPDSEPDTATLNGLSAQTSSVHDLIITAQPMPEQPQWSAHKRVTCNLHALPRLTRHTATTL